MTQELITRITDLANEGSTSEIQSLAFAILALQAPTPTPSVATAPVPTPEASG